MTQANMTREGRYTGPSLQAEGYAYRTTNKVAAPRCTVVLAAPKRTRAEADAARTAEAIADLKKEGGIVALGAWQTGTGNYKKARAVPDGAVVFTKIDAEPYIIIDSLPARPPRAPAHVCAWFADHPRAQRCVALIAPNA